jgi:hypothetical protein
MDYPVSRPSEILDQGSSFWPTPQHFFSHSLSLTLSLSHSLSSAAYAPSFPLSIKDVSCKNWSSLNKRISPNVVHIAFQNFIFPILSLHQMPHNIICLFFSNDFGQKEEKKLVLTGLLILDVTSEEKTLFLVHLH